MTPTAAVSERGQRKNWKGGTRLHQTHVQVFCTAQNTSLLIQDVPGQPGCTAPT